MHTSNKEIASILGLPFPELSDIVTIDTIEIDSRNVRFPERTLFVALQGAKSSGADFIEKLIKQSVTCFLVDKKYEGKWSQKGITFFYVANPLEAWQQLVTAKRKEYHTKTIGITGSNGKTVVKEWLSQILTPYYSICKNPKSYNSQIGVPLSVWNLNMNNSLAIFEAGISMPGEMVRLEKMISPNIGIFTNIGDAHQSNFRSMEEKVREKLNLFAHAELLIVRSEWLQQYPKPFNELCLSNKQLKILRWSEHSEAEAKVTVNASQRILKLAYQAKEYHLPLQQLEKSYIENIVHCALTVLALHLDLEAIIPSLSQLSNIEMRLEIIEGTQAMTIINDTYNADLDSLMIALQYLFAQTATAKKSIILSEIQQGGEGSITRIAELLSDKSIANLVLIGESYQEYADRFKGLQVEKLSLYATTEEFLRCHDANVFKNQVVLIKGARQFQLERIVQQYRKKTHSTYLKVHLNALKNNLRVFSKRLDPNTKIMLMLKASGYGLGSIELARQLENERVDYYAVAYTDEAIELRNIGVQKPIMVLNPEIGALSKLIEYQLEPEIYSLGILEKLIDELQQTPRAASLAIHLKLETGMHRLGITEAELPQVMALLKSNSHIHVKYLMTHLAASESAQFDYFTEEQIAKFQALSKQIESALVYTIPCHVLNTGGIVRHSRYQMDMVRLGIGLFGLDSTGCLQHELQNTISLMARIAQIKFVRAGDTIGYSRRGTAERNTKIGIINVGYADGYNRSFGNGVGAVYVNGQFAPTIGNICMDMTMVDLTDVPHVSEGDEAELIGSHVSVAELAAKAGTISYEILTSISNRVQRVYWED